MPQRDDWPVNPTLTARGEWIPAGNNAASFYIPAYGTTATTANKKSKMSINTTAGGM